MTNGFLSRRSVAMAGALVLAAVLGFRPALAEETDAAGPSISGPIEEVIVMARRKAENLQDVPLAVTAMSEGGLEARGITEIVDLEGAVPNLAINAGRVSDQQFATSLRGRVVGSDFLSLDQAVSLYSDSVNLPRSMSVSAIMVDVDRVEILRGPQGTLYGRNSTGGAVAVYSNEPTDEPSGSVRVEAGNYASRVTQGVANIPLGDHAALRVVAQLRSRDGYAENAAGHELANIDESAFYRAVFRSDVSDRFSVRAMFASFEQEGTSAVHVLTSFNPQSGALSQAACEIVNRRFCDLPGDFATVPGLFAALGQAGAAFADALARSQADPSRPQSTLGGMKPYSDGESLQASLQLEFDMTDSLLLRSITGYNEVSRNAMTDVDGTPFAIMHINWESENEFFSQELQLLGSFDYADWVLGLYFANEEGAEANPVYALAQVNPLSPFNFQTDGIENDTRAAFGQVDWSLDDDWTLTAGYRYTIDERSTDASSTVGQGLCVVPAPGAPGGEINLFGFFMGDFSSAQCPRTFDDEFKDDSWVLSLQRTLPDGSMIYGKASKGYRTGGYNLRVAFSVDSGQAVRPETVLEYELGVKTDLAGGALRLNAAMFFDDYDDMHEIAVVDTAAGLPATITENAASAEVFGMEAEARLRLSGAFDVDAHFGYLDTEYTEYLRSDGLDFSGHPLIGAPEWTTGIGAQYSNTLGFGEMFFRIDYQWRAEVDYEGGTGESIAFPGIGVRDSYGLLNARLSFDISDWNATIALWGRNLTDEAFETQVIVNNTGLGVTTQIMGAPRTYGISFTKRFGNI